MIKGIGVDLVDYKRIDLKIARKVLSSEEMSVFNSLKEHLKKEYLAERFAVKEALYKADNSLYNYDKISVLNDEKGKPFLKDLKGYVSITHDGGLVCAFVILED